MPETAIRLYRDAAKLVLKPGSALLPGFLVRISRNRHRVAVNHPALCEGMGKDEPVPASEHRSFLRTVGDGHNRITGLFRQGDDPGLNSESGATGAVRDDHRGPVSLPQTFDQPCKRTKPAP